MFLLLLMGLGAAGVKAQVRIGGNTPPQGAAILDLNADNTATPAANKGALALPRVSLTDTLAQLNGAIPITGMLIYNTNASMTGGNGVGIYFWDSSRWVRTASLAPAVSNVVTWTKCLDTTVTLGPVAAGSFVSFTSPTTTAIDFCTNISTDVWAPQTATGHITMWGPASVQMATSYNFRIVCYRPYLTK